jgi:hypothetical protein
MKNKLYCCIRCGYESIKKSNINNHFNRKVECPATNNDIELTDEIKKYILKNRIYKIPKIPIIPTKVINISNPDIIENINEYHYIYMIRPKENVRHNENVYKIGKTKVKNPDINISRLISYGKGTEIIHLQQCNNCDILEKEILEEFTIKFNKHTFGNEYFVGDKYDMLELIGDITLKHNKKYKL